MINRINLRLATEREIGDADQLKLCAMHNAMDLVVEAANREEVDLSETVKQLEYIMQSLWKFPEQSQFHTHYRRLKICQE